MFAFDTANPSPFIIESILVLTTQFVNDFLSDVDVAERVNHEVRY